MSQSFLDARKPLLNGINYESKRYDYEVGSRVDSVLSTPPRVLSHIDACGDVDYVCYCGTCHGGTTPSFLESELAGRVQATAGSFLSRHLNFIGGNRRCWISAYPLISSRLLLEGHR
jgi:hypothetical protein